MPRPEAPPELVQENTVDIGPDGLFELEIDTAFAKELRGDVDHLYSITAEVVDESRRSVLAQGSFIAARKPFSVYLWLNKGYFDEGDKIAVNVSASTPNKTPVSGSGKLVLYRMNFDAQGELKEELVEELELAADSRGEASTSLRAPSSGQYRVSYTLNNGSASPQEGGAIFTVRGTSQLEGENFRFAELELIAEKKEYTPGEKAELLLTSEKENSRVLLFVRPVAGVYSEPVHLDLQGKSAVYEMAVASKDVPNFFVEAVRIGSGKLHREVLEIFVPPAKKVLKAELESDKESYRPGEKAEFRLKVVDAEGEPVSASTVLTAYDRSLEYISGGSNVPDIAEFFWKWRRSHNPRETTNASLSSSAIYRPGAVRMASLGIFGGHLPFGKTELEADGLFANANQQRESAPMSKSLRAGVAGALADESVEEESSGSSPQEQTPVLVRANFADSVYWSPDAKTDSRGEHRFEFNLPDNLTSWKVIAWTLSDGAVVGQVVTEVQSKKNVILRMQKPRFLIEGDRAALSANLHNYSEKDLRGTASLELSGESLVSVNSNNLSRKVEIESQGEKRVDWLVSAENEGVAELEMKLISRPESDAVLDNLPVYPRAALITESKSGFVDEGQAGAKFVLQVPEKREAERSRLEIRYTPTLAAAIVDAIPYLVSLDYKTTDETLNSFYPAAISRKVLSELGMNLEEIAEKLSNLNSTEIGEDKKRAEDWQRVSREKNPLFDSNLFSELLEKRLESLASMQLSNGAWGWFSGYRETPSAYLTAYIVNGLKKTKASGFALPSGMLERGLSWLRQQHLSELKKLENAKLEIKPYKRKPSNLDSFIAMVLEDSAELEMLELLYKERNSLSLYAKATLAIALHKRGDSKKVAMLKRNIEQYLIRDEENQTAYLNLPNTNYWWFWYGSEIEAQAYYLKLLSLLEPKGEVAPRLAKYLLVNRKHASYWSSKRDTALAVEALAEFLSASGELEVDLNLEIFLNSEKKKELSITRNNLFHFDNKLVVEGDELKSGKLEVEIRKTGRGPLYYNSYFSNFSKEDVLKSAGLELKISRKFYKLSRKEKSSETRGAGARPVAQDLDKYERRELASGEELKSGDLVEVELEIESKNDYEYLVLEDKKAAGLEAVEVRSGYTDNALNAYAEFRDRKVLFFLRSLARGKHSLSYRLRAETPGSFSALPAIAKAVYAPELRGNSEEMKLGVQSALP